MSRPWIRITFSAALLLLLSGCAGSYYRESYYGSPPPPPPAHRYYDYSIFYDDLSPYGQWFEYGDFGWVWTPYGVSMGWRPYTDGYWAYTDYGWTWVSLQPWGWAPFHYGRWLFDDDYGWVWVPGSVWGPAWVEWRDSDDWVGWAPLPPPGVSDPHGDRVRYRDLGPHGWCFVPRRDFTSRRLRPRLAPVPRNVTLMTLTRPLPQPGGSDLQPKGGGPDVSGIERALGRPVPRYRVADEGQPRRTMKPGAEVLGVYRPSIGEPEGSAERPKPPAQVGTPLRPAVQRQREVREQRRLESQLEQERRQLESRHKRELRRTEGGKAGEEVRATQEAERRAFEEQADRERRVMKERVDKGLARPATPTRRENAPAPERTPPPEKTPGP